MKTCQPAALFFAICLIFAFPTICTGQPRYAPSVERFGIQEIVLHSSRHYDNPFRDVSLSAKFTCAGEQVNGLGFYDGNSIWKVRFMPQQLEHCKFETTSNDPDI